jgi:CHAT domain-containing protein/Tfp pilus assembly protein PilF
MLGVGVMVGKGYQAWPGLVMGLAVVCPPLMVNAQPIRPSLQLSQASPLQRANALNQQVIELYQAGRYGEAIDLAEEALAIYRQQLGNNHPDVATGLNNLAALYRAQSRYIEAEPLYLEALAIYRQQLGNNHPSVANSLNSLALLYRNQGRYGEAEPLFQNSLAIYRQQLGDNHPSVANSLNSLALLYRDQGRYGEAEPLFQNSLAIYRQQLGDNHPSVANSLNSLALLYRDQGRYGEAEPLYLEALSIRQQQLGDLHPDVALSLNNLAVLYRDQGRYSEAESLFQEALDIHRRRFGDTHPEVAQSLNNLAVLYQDQGRDREAESLYLEALSIRREQLGDTHPSIATSLNNLALLYLNQSRYSEAESLFQEALDIRRQQLGENHPDVAQSLNNLAGLYQDQGRYIEAESLFQDALDMRRQQLGENHPDVAQSLNNLAGIYWAQEQLQATLTILSQGIAIEESILNRNLIGGNDTNKRNYLATVSGTTDATISLSLNALPTDLEAIQLAFSTLLQRKGRVLDIFTNLLNQVRNDPVALTLLDELSAVNARLSVLHNAPPDNPAEQDTYQVQLGELQQRSRELNDELSRFSTDFAALAASPTVHEIASALPDDTALIEFIRYRPVAPIAPIQKRYGSHHYAAYILRDDGTLHGIDLGAAADIDTAVERLAADLSTAGTPIGQVKQSAQALDALVMAPVRELLGDTTTVFLSPDGNLNLIPFEALVDESGDYLVETYQFRYLTSGRDLLRLDLNPASDNPPLLVGNPTYGRPGELIAQSRAIDFENRIFPALPGTGREVEAISAQLPDALVFSETNATEAVIKEHPQPGILHIATHGFFEASQDSPNPLLQSGLILAGAALEDRQSGPEQDGILTALEVTGLDLRGTQLVVLSACETGVGELAAGEGVYGLRRALVLAGSHSQVISLWKVDDTATQELMVAYYDRLLSGMPRDAALRETQLAFLNSTEYRHPYYWAAFIGSGDWRPLQP